MALSRYQENHEYACMVFLRVSSFSKQGIIDTFILGFRTADRGSVIQKIRFMERYTRQQARLYLNSIILELTGRTISLAEVSSMTITARKKCEISVQCK